MIAEGDEGEINAFLQGIRDSELGSYLRGENVSWMPATAEFKGFDIRHH